MFATKKWYVIHSESNGSYSHHDPIKFLTKSTESSLCAYFDAYILVTGNIALARTITSATAGADPQRKQPLNAVTQVALKICAPFKACRTEISDAFFWLCSYVGFINIAIPMYNLIWYSDSYSDTPGSLLGFKRDEVLNNPDMTNDDNAPSFKHKAGFIASTEADGTKNEVKMGVPLKYLSNFWRSLEMPLINCKAELSLKWI